MRRTNMKGEIWSWDASTTAAAIRAGKISSRQAIEAALGRLREVNPAINAVVETLEEEALAAADRADRTANLEAAGPLHGVPVTTKINVDLAGHATTNGLVAMKDALAGEDSAPVAALRRAGAIIIGRTNVPAFSYRWFTGNDLHGTTKNPWNPKLSPGGSSGGAAAATAVGIGAFGHGNDVAGSLRLPASACGIYGMRPTVGRLPSYNPSQRMEPSLCLQIGATEGLLARSVRDLRIGLAALEARDHRDPWQTPAPMPREADRLPCKVALFTGEQEFGTAPEIVSLVRKAAGWLEQAGYLVEEVRLPPLADIAELWMAMLYAECSGPVREAMFELGGDAFRRSFIDSAANFPVLDASSLYRAWERRLSIQREWAVFLSEYPIVLMPTSLQPTFPIDHDLAGPDALAAICKAFTPLSSIAGLALPAISVPAGSAAGAPAGVQIISGRFMEDRCLAAAAVMEEHIGKLRPIDPKVA
ncbi:amidase [Bradyrhizobium sp. ORS 375]|uniref:amidase n=1 Tax=Bradyrhizobium sp. (strain ORS 375) TaxID=566679 RepID=UPI0032DFE461